MDLSNAIERHRDALAAIVTALFVLLGLPAAGRISRELRSSVLRVLGPAESAVRRLIFVAARDLAVVLRPSRPAPAGLTAKRSGAPAFQLCDARQRFGRERLKPIAKDPPRLFFFSGDPRVAALPMWASPAPAAEDNPAPLDGATKASPLLLRLQALDQALADLPRQALRLARWRARRARRRLPGFSSPLRSGPPPGRRLNETLPVDALLAQCHELAHEVSLAAVRPGPS